MCTPWDPQKRWRLVFSPNIKVGGSLLEKRERAGRMGGRGSELGARAGMGGERGLAGLDGWQEDRSWGPSGTWVGAGGPQNRQIGVGELKARRPADEHTDLRVGAERRTPTQKVSAPGPNRQGAGPETETAGPRHRPPESDTLLTQKPPPARHRAQSAGARNRDRWAPTQQRAPGPDESERTAGSGDRPGPKKTADCQDSTQRAPQCGVGRGLPERPPRPDTESVGRGPAPRPDTERRARHRAPGPDTKSAGAQHRDRDRRVRHRERQERTAGPRHPRQRAPGAPAPT